MDRSSFYIQKQKLVPIVLLIIFHLQGCNKNSEQLCMIGQEGSADDNLKVNKIVKKLRSKSSDFACEKIEEYWKDMLATKARIIILDDRMWSLSQKSQKIELNVAELIKDANTLKEQIKEWSVGESVIKVCSVQYEYGESVTCVGIALDGFYSELFDLESFNCIKGFFPNTPIHQHKYIAGIDEFSMEVHVHADKEYFYTTNLDYEKYLKKYLNSSRPTASFNLNKQHRVDVISENVIFIGFLLCPNSNEIVYQLILQFKKGYGLPYLKIQHTISNKILNNDLIINAQSKLERLQRRIRSKNLKLQQIEEDIIELKTRKESLSTLMQYIKSEVQTPSTF